MYGEISSSTSAWQTGALTAVGTDQRIRIAPSTPTARTVRVWLLLLAVFVSAWASLAFVNTPSQVPGLWPAGGVIAGLLLTSPTRTRPWLLPASLLLILAAYVVHGYDVLPALGYSASFVAAAWLVRQRLAAGHGGRRAALRDAGDVSQFVGAITTGSLLAGAGYGLTDWVVGQGNPLLGALGAFGANAAALMVLLPLFLKAVVFKPLAGPRERVLQAVLTLGTTIAVFFSTDIPPVVFAVMPMFAWHAFRGTLREATVLLTLVAVIGSTASMLEIGPIWELGARYGLQPEIVAGILQLFLLDCGLILLPLSVMVTQQRMSADRADAGRETLQRLVASATGTAIIATGPDGRITLFNPGAEAMLGYTSEEVLGRRPDMFHPEDELRHQASRLHALPTFADICRASIAAEDGNRLWLFLRRDGEERIMRMTLTGVPDESGELSGYLATAEDVTEREHAHRAMLLTVQHQRTAVERLQELERVKSDFVSTVSHELRTPITSIIGYTELLEDGLVGELTAAQNEIIDRVDRNGRRLLLLVEDLLTLSQIESSALKIDPVVTDIRSVVTNAHGSLAPSLAGRSLDVSVSTPRDPVVHHGDPVQLERMLTNLLTNAVKFTPDGGNVEVALHSDGELSRIVVSDTGVGITKEDQTKLFTRFFRSDSSTEQAVQGTGLGLTIVQAIVALHGGKVGVSSTHGQGTTVTVTLPRVAVATPVAGTTSLGSATG
ncbi:MAG: domain S-box protein [Marmoricola sp.]|nr:domain S-box protein [Marmoricola sp.]